MTIVSVITDPHGLRRHPPPPRDLTVVRAGVSVGVLDKDGNALTTRSVFWFA